MRWPWTRKPTVITIEICLGPDRDQLLRELRAAIRTQGGGDPGRALS